MSNGRGALSLLRAWGGQAIVVAATALLAACATGPGDAPQADDGPDQAVSAAAARPGSEVATASGAEVRRGRPALLPLETVSIGAPTIRFRSLDGEPDVRDSDSLSDLGGGTASWYGLQFHGRQTANGERYNMYELTAAHRTLPFGTVVRVRSLQNGRTVQVRINDRGPYVDGRVIDLSKAAAEELGMKDQGVKPVSLTVTEWPDLDKGAPAKPGRPPAGPKATAQERNSPGKDKRTVEPQP